MSLDNLPRIIKKCKDINVLNLGDQTDFGLCQEFDDIVYLLAWWNLLYNLITNVQELILSMEDKTVCVSDMVLHLVAYLHPLDDE